MTILAILTISSSHYCERITRTTSDNVVTGLGMGATSRRYCSDYKWQRWLSWREFTCACTVQVLIVSGVHRLINFFRQNELNMSTLENTEMEWEINSSCFKDIKCSPSVDDSVHYVKYNKINQSNLFFKCSVRFGSGAKFRCLQMFNWILL